ncbi:hypothetical protein ACFL27_26790 [candidate division CSSED10-310 bacterium]|uniref:Co-chaperone DjlA N-terminal domain-containing protein n=1 Tax=candidate division CSSED10-310 bacterium TaxID=2855610 RepID=A0ABV6Z5U1_UNCC1
MMRRGIIEDKKEDQKHKIEAELSNKMMEVFESIAISRKDYYSEHPDESLGLLMDLIALAKRDNEFHVTEKMYIKKVGSIIGYSAEDIVMMME